MNVRERFKEIITDNIPFIFSTPAILWQILFLYIPFFIIVYSSFRYADTSWYVLNFDNYAVLCSLAYLRIVARSAVIATFVALICLICAYPVAYFLALKVHARWKNILLFLLTLPFWTNLLILIYSWVFILDHNGLINTFLLRCGIIEQPLHMANSVAAIILVMLYYYVPFMIMPLYSVLEKIQHDLLEASMDLGATHWQTFSRITLPLSLVGVKTGFLLVFVPAFGDFAIPALIGGSRHLFVGSLISHYFLVVRDTGLGAAFTIVSGIMLVICSLLFNWLADLPYRATQKEEAS